MAIKKIENIENKNEAINEYALINKDEILNSNSLLINGNLHNYLLNKYNTFTFNLNFHNEDEMLNTYGITFEDLTINRKMPQLYKLAYKVFINRDTPTLHNKECLKLTEIDNGYTVKDTTKTIKKIIDTDDLNQSRAKRLAKNYYYTNSDQYKCTNQIICSAGTLNISRDNRTKAGIRNIYVVSIEIDLHDIEDISLLQQKKEEIKTIIKAYDLPGTVCYTTNRSIYLQYTLSHSINQNDYDMIKKVLAHRLYMYTGLNADLANMNPAIIHHVKLTLHDKNNMQSIVAPFMWYDIPYDTGKLLRYCKWYMRNYSNEFNNYFKQTPNEYKVNYQHIQLQYNTLNFLLKNEEINKNFTIDSLYKTINSIKSKDSNIYGFNILFHELNNLYNTDNIIKQSYGQQISDINVINNFLTVADINIINHINNLTKEVKELKTGNLLNDKYLKQILNYKYNINNDRLHKIATWLYKQQDLINQCKEYYQLSSVIIKYCQWIDLILITINNEIENNKIIYATQQIDNEKDIENISIQDHIGFIPFEWKDAKQILKTKYISCTYIKQEEKKIINTYDITNKVNTDADNNIKYSKMIKEYINAQGILVSNVLREEVIPSLKFKYIFNATQKFKNDTLEEKDINYIRKIFNLHDEERNMSYTLAMKTILRELGQQLHTLCNVNLETLKNKKSIKHQFFSEKRASMIFNTEVECKFANCYIETFYSFNGKPSGSILDLITWCFANKDITYNIAKDYAIKFLARILNINIRSQKSVNYSHIHAAIINDIDKLINKLTVMLDNNRSRKSNSLDLIRLANLIKNKLIENSYYESNIKVLKKYNSLDKEKVFNTQAMITTNYLHSQFGWNKSKSSRLINMLLDAGIFRQITSKNDIANKQLQYSLNKHHNIPFIITFVDFNKQLKFKNNHKTISNYCLSKLKIEYIFNLERLTKIKYNNWSVNIKDTFQAFNALFTVIEENSITSIHSNNAINIKNYSSINNTFKITIENKINIVIDINQFIITDMELII